jgi:hypothetical protein
MRLLTPFVDLVFVPEIHYRRAAEGCQSGTAIPAPGFMQAAVAAIPAND